MKVLMLDQWLPGQPYALDVCRPLSGRVDLTLLTNRYYHPQNEAFRCISVLESRVKQGPLGPLLYLRGLLSLYGNALFGPYDVIHVQAFKRPRLEMPACLLAKRLAKKKLVCTAHNILPHERGGAGEAERMKKWYRACDAIVVHNEYSRRALAEFEPSAAEKTRVTPHGTFREFAAFAKEQNHEKTVFLAFGMIRKYKGIGDLLKAAALLPEELREKIRIVIAGKQLQDLDDTDYGAMLARYGLEDFVEFSPRRIPDEQLPDCFNGADCCVFPYTEIYGSGALLMAYTFGKPVLASAIPAFVEETENGKTGLLYEPGSAQGLADAIRRFTELTGAEKTAIKQRIRELCETKYNWDKSADILAGVYRSVTGKE